MKKRLRYALFIAVSLFVAAAVLAFEGLLVLDHSARTAGEGVRWKGHFYEPASADDYSEGRTLAKTNDGWNVKEVEEDPGHTFIVLRSFLDQHLCVREDYEIPKSGQVTAVYLDGEKIDAAELAAAAEYVLENFTPQREYVVEHIGHDTETQQMRDISYCFEGCPVGIDRNGDHIGCIDGEWVLARRTGKDGENRIYDLYEIPGEYVDILAKYCKK